MKRLTSLLFLALLAVSACAPAPVEVRLGPDGKPLPQVYRIGNEGTVQFRMLDAVNALRRSAGVRQVELNSELNAAAATHSRDMSIQNRPWHFGSDGSSPIDRVRRVGYRGALTGENISETYETELQTLAAWMQDPNTRLVILDPQSANMGFAWHQEPSGKIWWTLVMARDAPSENVSSGIATIARNAIDG